MIHSCYGSKPCALMVAHARGIKAKLRGCHNTQRMSASTATLSTLLVFSVGSAWHPLAQDPVPGSRTPLPTAQSSCCPWGLGT